MEKLYVLFQDTVGGELFIRETEDDDFTYQELGGCYANNIFESEDENEVLRKYDEIYDELIRVIMTYLLKNNCNVNLSKNNKTCNISITTKSLPFNIIITKS